MDSSKTFSCEICENTFSTNRSKDKHISIVHGDIKNFECNVCSKAFGARKDLGIHRQTIHDGKRNYICKSCGKSFNKSGLKVHIKIRQFQINENEYGNTRR